MLTAYILYVMKMSLYFYDRSLKNLSLSHKRGKQGQTPIEGHPTKYLTSIPQTVKVIKSKEGLRNCHGQEKPRET
jgi:hypothetical protein